MSDNTPILTVLLEELQEVTDWRMLGAYLDMPDHVLDRINTEQSSVKDYKVAMLQYWLENTKSASWSNLASALEQTNHLGLAARLRLKYWRTPLGIVPDGPVPTVQEMLELLRGEVGNSNWVKFGIALGVPIGYLRKAESLFSDMSWSVVTEWLCITPGARWQQVIAALEELDMTNLASRVKQKYLPEVSDTPSGATPTVQDVTASHDEHSKQDPLQSAPEITDLLNLIAARANEKWKVVGLQLKLSLQLLNSIDEKYKQTVLCYAEMFQVWKNNGDPPFTWGTIIDALKAPIVGETQLATELQESLCKQ